MINQLKIEWMKVKTYKAFILLSIFFVVGIFLVNYIVYSFTKNVIEPSDPTHLISGFNPYGFELVWQTISYVSGYLLILPAMLLIMLVTNEYTFRTNRQNIIDGWSRHQFIHVKMLSALIFSLGSTMVIIMAGMTFGFSIGDSFSLNGFTHVGFFFMKSLTYNLLAVLIAVLIKRTGFAMGVFFVYMGAENILSQLLYAWSRSLKSNGVGDFGDMGDYLPMNASDGLLTFPSNPLKSIVTTNAPSNYTMLVFALAVVYMVIFYRWGRANYMKKDL